MTSPDIPRVVLDTSVVSIIHNSDYRSSYYESRIGGLHAAISFQTLEEKLFGAHKAGWGRRRIADLKRHMEQYQVIWADDDLVDISARLRSERIKAGRELKTADAWIAATAIKLGCPLATHDNDFDGIPNLEIIKRPPG